MLCYAPAANETQECEASCSLKSELGAVLHLVRHDGSRGVLNC